MVWKKKRLLLWPLLPLSADKMKTWYTFGIYFYYSHLFPFAINLKLGYFWQLIQELMNVQQKSVNILPQAAFRSGRYIPQWGMGSFAEGNFFSFVTNSSLTLKLNICILELSILFSKDLLFSYYIKVIGFWFFSIFLIYFILLFYPRYVLDFMMYHIWYTIHFFSKNR